MRKVINYYRLVNILSIDVALGAVICALFFSKIFNVEIRLSGIFCLGLSVWIIYTADHLLDAFGVQHEASTARHRFHQQNKRPLIVILLCVLVINATQLFFIRESVLLSGVILLAIITVYFILQKHLKFIKEFLGALLYTGGVLLVPLSLKFEYISLPHAILIIQFFITALLNLLLFAWFDYEKDFADRRESSATIFGSTVVKKIITLLFFINGILSLFLLLSYSIPVLATAILVVMNLILMALSVNKVYFSINDRYRIVGDGIFIIPLFYFISH